jgi:hypothetical protein
LLDDVTSNNNRPEPQLSNSNFAFSTIIADTWKHILVAVFTIKLFGGAACSPFVNATMPSLGRALLLATAALALLQVTHAVSNQCACAQGQPGGQASAADVMQQWDDCSGAVLYYTAHVIMSQEVV